MSQPTQAKVLRTDASGIDESRFPWRGRRPLVMRPRHQRNSAPFSVATPSARPAGAHADVTASFNPRRWMPLDTRLAPRLKGWKFLALRDGASKG